MSKSLSRELLRERAKICEHAERFDDMLKDVTEIARMDGVMDNDERNLLSVAYKNVVGERRSSWRVLVAVYAKTIEEDSSRKAKLTDQYRVKVEEEMEERCGDLLKLLDDDVLPKSEDPASKVFYLKMKGDYNRYLAEIFERSTAKGERAAKQAEESYDKAMEIAKESLTPVDPIRLGLVLNFSVFHYEIAQSPTTACSMAKEAFDEGVNSLEDDSGPSYGDTTAILQLLKDNLDTWAGGANDQ